MEDYIQKNNLKVEYELKKIQLEISSLKIMWEDGFRTIHIREFDTDNFWHRRHTQYTKGKNVLISLINLVLRTGDSRWTALKNKDSQKFRDALVLSSHMSSFYKNLERKIFVKL